MDPESCVVSLEKGWSTLDAVYACGRLTALVTALRAWRTLAFLVEIVLSWTGQTIESRSTGFTGIGADLALTFEKVVAWEASRAIRVRPFDRGKTYLTVDSFTGLTKLIRNFIVTKSTLITIGRIREVKAVRRGSHTATISNISHLDNQLI